MLRFKNNFTGLWKASVLYVLCSMLLVSARAAPTCPPCVCPSIPPSIFSTSTDWEAVTGMRLSEFMVSFGRDGSIGNIGWEIYFLDGFPCYGQSETARMWVSPSRHYAIDGGADARGRITCLYAPKTVKLAWREARRDAAQARTRGMAVCEVEHSGRNITIRLDKCERTDWGDLR